MTVSSVTGAAAATTSSASKTGFGALGATDFLKMLTAQLKNQDPTAPTDNAAMIAQLAQFSTLSNSTEMASSLQAIATKLDAVIGALNAKSSATTTTTTA